MQERLKPIICSVCGKPFIRAANHLYTYKNEEGHKCYVCSYKCYRAVGGDPERIPKYWRLVK